MRARASLLIGAMLLGGCMTLQGYDGERRQPDELARISGDPRITAGSPVTAVLRQVDRHTLGLGQSSVDVLPGPHRLLVDCRVAETESVSRHSLDVEVSAGGRYRLVAETGPGLKGCTAVRLEAVD
jgi:hypothetical protein